MNPVEVQGMAAKVVKKLQLEREVGRATPDHPMTGPDIVAAYNLKFGTDVRDKDLAEVIHYARKVMKARIGSNTRGYYWCNSVGEYEEFHAREVARNIHHREAIDAPLVAMKSQQQMELHEGGGVIAALKELFGAERVTTTQQ